MHEINKEKEFKLSDEEIENIINAVTLSGDLRKGVGMPAKLIEDALFAKLIYPSLLGVRDSLEEIANDSKEIAVGLINSVLSETERSHLEVQDKRRGAIERALAKISSSEDASLFSNALDTGRSAKQCLDALNDQGTEIENFGALLLDALSSCNKMRVAHDVVPLIIRGLYSQDVQEALRLWEANKNDPKSQKDEGFWQKALTQQKTVLQRALGGKVILINPQAHVGSEGLDGIGDRITDFLLQHKDTKNVILVEIKTPVTQLLGEKYRNTYGLSQELSGSASQVMLQRHDAMINYYSKRVNSNIDFTVAAPKCIVIAGRVDTEIGSDQSKRLAFEMQRDAIGSNVRIITFDELYADFANFHVLTQNDAS